MIIQEMVVPALSRNDIRQKTLQLRKMFRLDQKFKFPIVKFMEMLPEFIEDFDFQIWPTYAMKNYHGLTMDNGLVVIREDVYIKAANDDGCARDTMAHELGHWFLHRGKKAHARIANGPVPAYESPEWQAKAFSGELLVPFHLIDKSMTADEVARLCGVSRSAAAYQLKKIPRKLPC